ncbi:MAG: penicillin-binding protein 1C [Acidobacteriota bacterium]
MTGGVHRLVRRCAAALRRHLRWLIAAPLALLAVAWGLAWWIPLPPRLAESPSTVVLFRDGSPAFVFLSPDDKYRMAVRPEDLGGNHPGAVDADYLEALFRFEDKRFRLHPGVDPLAVMRSAWANLRAGRVVTGASTLTMQLVRLVEPRPRTLRSKAVEALRALQLEARMSKDEVLAAYLSFLPFGRNVEGLPAASWAYFGHGPRDLSPEEIAVLLAVPQRPTQRYPAPQNVPRLRSARDEIAGWLLDEGALGAEGQQTGDPAREGLRRRIAGTDVPGQIRPLPRRAPHAAFWFAAQHPGETRIPTTLDRGLQAVAEDRLRAARGDLAAYGIHNGTAVLADHRTGEVLSLVGNLDFWDAEHGGQIAGFDTPRSPGSALKPFLYAMAIDRGLALPEHLVEDIPTAWVDYAPSNYDGRFAGLVSLEDALSHSLNIPFVRLLGRLGTENFVATLRQAGAASLRPQPGHYGLSAAIGAVEVTPLEVAGLYAALAHGGRYRALRWRPRTGEDAELPLLTPGAAHLTRRALARRDRPDFPTRRQWSGAPASIHWKTGTSYGHRDAWAAGSGPRLTAVVWLGNFDNAPAVDLVGAEAAGPILFDLLEAAADRSLPTFGDPPPQDLARVEVCAFSGHLPTEACDHRAHALAPRSRVPTAPCPYHRTIEVDLDSGLAVNPSCRSGRRYEERSFLVLPASVRRWLAREHRFLPSPPSLDPSCRRDTAGRAPEILSPPAGQVLVLVPGLPTSDQEVPLTAEATAAGRLSWFVNGELLATADAGERVWWQPVPGRHEITVVDEAGRTARRSLDVRSSRAG